MSLDQQKKCPFCDQEHISVQKQSGDLIEYRCSQCNDLLEVYHRDMHEALRNLFKGQKGG